MASVEYSTPVHSLSGRVGDAPLVYYTSRGRGFVRAFTPPSRPPSADQLAVRSFIAAGSKHWAALSHAQRAGWEAYARSFFGREVDGETVALSGALLYNKVAFFRLAMGFALPADAPGSGPPAPVESFAQLPADAPERFRFAVHHPIADASNYKLLARITAPVGPGVAPYAKTLRWIRGVGAASFLPLPASGGIADFAGARYGIPDGAAYRAELTVLSPECVPSPAAGMLFLR